MSQENLKEQVLPPETNPTSVLDLASSRLKFRRKLRHINDRVARVAIAVGGIGVIVAILMIFLYLFYEDIPLFKAASAERVNQYQLAGADQSAVLHLAIEEQS